jgi:hypothetical protein
MTPQQEREWREHPPHLQGHSVPGRNGSVFIVDPPAPLPTLTARWRRRRECRLKGGHWWHAEGLIDWFCCYCGKQTDGSPRDGASR